MNNQILIIYNFSTIYEILYELENYLNFKVIKLNKGDLASFKNKEKQNFILLTKEKVQDIENQFILNNFPLRLFDLVENLNIKFLKVNYKGQSNHKVKDYTVDLNSKSLSKENKILKLTEKEISTILYLTRNQNPTSIKELQTKVWDHKSVLETHTVETHIHRLRKKIKEKFSDENFIISSKDGYFIN
tara:strand:+ start:3319 stop:3882 length:564 start_codon:yes stop_codon:yes gene_type:complete